jgi:hypothetical protein
MKRRERRRRKRKQKKLEAMKKKGKALAKHATVASSATAAPSPTAVAPSPATVAPSPIATARGESKGLLARAREYLRRATPNAKLVKGFLVTVLAFLSGYALLRPNLSVEPGIQLDPTDPFSTQFEIRNQNRFLAIHDISLKCSIILAVTPILVVSNQVNEWPHAIPEIEANKSSTVPCQRNWGGFGLVKVAAIEIEISSRPDWWPFHVDNKFPFLGVRDAQDVLHWTHRTESEIAQMPELRDRLHLKAPTP